MLQFLVFTWRHSSHVGVQNNSEKSLLGIWFYYYAKLERHFAIVLYTNMAVSSSEWKPRIASGRTKGAHEKSFVFVHQHGGYDVAWKSPTQIPHTYFFLFLIAGWFNSWHLCLRPPSWFLRFLSRASTTWFTITKWKCVYKEACKNVLPQLSRRTVRKSTYHLKQVTKYSLTEMTAFFHIRYVRSF
mgnify:CR=1 FL=1